MTAGVTRRVWLGNCAGALAFGQAPAFVRGDRPDPQAVMAGDVVPGSAIIWSRADRPARMIVNWSTSERGPVQTLAGPHCIDATDYTGRVELTGLPAGQTILYEVRFQNLRNDRSLSEPLRGTFRTPPAGPRNLRFLWTGDQVGQGWGINPEWGGFRIYDVMARRDPDFFLHSGDVDLCRWPAVAGGPPAGWNRVAERRDRSQEQSRRDPRRVSRPVSIQPARRTPAALLLHGRPGLAVGRSRSDEQLVARQKRAGRRAVQGEGRTADGGARHPRVPGVRSAAPVGERDGACLPAHPVRSAARRVRAGHAQLSRPEHLEPSGAAGTRYRVSRAGLNSSG